MGSGVTVFVQEGLNNKKKFFYIYCVVNVMNVKQTEAQSARAESTLKGVN